LKLFWFAVVNIAETLLRFLPIPCKTGLRVLGNPDKESPVFLTCNFHLTVERVRHALKGMNAYLLVANSRGINVWCSSVGGHFTVHDVVSALKTSGIEKLVNHRRVILPQLAAAGIETKLVSKKTGWKVLWGPVYAKDIAPFVKNNLKKDQSMRGVQFPWKQRIEMAVAWAFPVSLVAGLIAICVSSSIFLPLVLLVWVLSSVLFLLFPLYSSWLRFKRGSERLVLIFWAIILSFLLVYSIVVIQLSWRFLIQWGLISFVIIFILSIDVRGSTPVFKSGLHEDKQLTVVIDDKKCKGAAFCENVCPSNCFKLNRQRRIPEVVNQDSCVHCGACIVQCPFDALFFESQKGEIIAPEIIRKYKVNLLGKRGIKLS